MRKLHGLMDVVQTEGSTVAKAHVRKIPQMYIAAPVRPRTICLQTNELIMTEFDDRNCLKLDKITPVQHQVIVRLVQK